MDNINGAGNQNNGRFDLSGNNPQNVNYPAPPPPPQQQYSYNYANNQMDNQRFNMNQPLMNNNMNPENPQQQQNRFDMSGQPPPPQMYPPAMNYAPQIQNEQHKEYVKPEMNYNNNQGMEKGNYQSEHAVGSGNPIGGAVNINVALPSMDNQAMYMQPPNQYPQDMNNYQNNQFQGQNINLPQAQNYIPGQQVNPPYNPSNPQLHAEQIKMNPQGQYIPPSYPVGAPIGPNMGNPNLPQGQPIMIQPLSNGQPQQIYAAQRQVNANVFPTNLDHCQYPQQMKCPACQRVGTSQVVAQTGSGTYTCCLLACCCIGICALPILCIDNFQDKQHFCPFCGYQVGYYKYEPC
ncbi:LITAF-like zinc ribbon domain protein (macronuclear) [Tetrahymena thermophila SB210]|uniref:LITAF-like zinc ribbon domain protein n=1 Tax=Tetrahymena thermophila (strain SB210) TaxID=312017 RepID=Q22U69_TETTS|nr:LITAF-like zinc ribbon domain protein [Tetrahymena thermophila SB210]EAR88818.1 LITAF-like zinc ribbon domain protein [Tetrahymena thermophila SB210]|eukprot:XP_001009063.1 LITAF-like zinc ribbon domain protein [Tetrahymena thermophila SB210]